MLIYYFLIKKVSLIFVDGPISCLIFRSWSAWLLINWFHVVSGLHCFQNFSLLNCYVFSGSIIANLTFFVKSTAKESDVTLDKLKTNIDKIIKEDADVKKLIDDTYKPVFENGKYICV